MQNKIKRRLRRSDGDGLALWRFDALTVVDWRSDGVTATHWRSDSWGEVTVMVTVTWRWRDATARVSIANRYGISREQFRTYNWDTVSRVQPKGLPPTANSQQQTTATKTRTRQMSFPTKRSPTWWCHVTWKGYAAIAGGKQQQWRREAKTMPAQVPMTQASESIFMYQVLKKIRERERETLMKLLILRFLLILWWFFSNSKLDEWRLSTPLASEEARIKRAENWSKYLGGRCFFKGKDDLHIIETYRCKLVLYIV